MKRAYEDKYIKIIKFIVDRGTTTHKEIGYMLGVSTKTVSKYLNEVSGIIEQTDLQLSVKPRVGVSIVGEKKSIDQLLDQLNTKHDETIEDREMLVYSQFLISENYLKIQELADELYVSRATMESTLKEVRKKFSEQGVEIKSTRNGLKLAVTENQRRNLMSNVINYYWGGIHITKDQKTELKLNIMMSAVVDNIVDLEILDNVTNVLNHFIECSELKITEYEYQSLAIHLVIAIERIKKDFYIDKPVNTSEIVLENATVLVTLLEQKFLIKIPLYEQQYINIHIAAIEKNTLNSMAETSLDILDLSEQLKIIISDVLSQYHPDEELVKNLLIHLNAAIKRLQFGLNIYNPYTDKICGTFQRSFEVAVALTKSLEQAFFIQLNDDEIAYITLHIQTFFDREPQKKTQVVVVCSSGYGTSKLLEQRIKKIFSKELSIMRVLSLKELQLTEVTEALVISTIPIEYSPVPVIVVTPLMNEVDVERIKRQIGHTRERCYDAFIKLIKDDLLFFSTKEKESQYSVLTTINHKLIEKGYLAEGIVESATNREKLSSTVIGNFAMPHAEVAMTDEPSISIYINPNGVLWGTEKVEIIFFFALNKRIKDSINEVYEFFNELISDYHVIHKLITATTVQEIHEYLKEVNI
ncbi:BglG family transcription antiterminator [Enterococcus ureasiticus]|uniref:Uncharacterized protein n=1 Tax=Enterococcus ureasiticus TaxID=903984 RepID=A0A1E5GA70_9ENTE|nr:PRD domain-containing protein [Enterococcus ureasiticus]OEG09551.1 hypothetical protein BCR21_14470 [Enterococcus ureasiticus]